MTPAAPHRPLLDALVLPLPKAAEAWRKWRAVADLDRLDSGSFHLLPALAGRMTEWVANDPQKDILLGFCRRAWSQNRVRLKLLAQAVEILSGAGIGRIAVTGPVLWAERYWGEGAIRTIGRVDLLVEPASARVAYGVLSKADWKSLHGFPNSALNQLYFAPGVLMQSPSGEEVWMHWRALPNTDLSLRRPTVPPLEFVPQLQLAPYALSTECSLIAALGGYHQDEIDWRCDALMICRHAVDWETVAALLRWRSPARERLVELERDWGVEVPAAVTKPAWTSGVERIAASALRKYRRHKPGQK